MIVKTRIFELCNSQYRNLSELAAAMGISVSQIYRVREGKRQINQKFIVGAIKAFPNNRFDDLFYLVSDSPDDDTSHHPRLQAAESAERPAVTRDTVSAITRKAIPP